MEGWRTLLCRKGVVENGGEFLPNVVLAPDLPVPKRSKVQLRDVTVNTGPQWHGLALINPLAPKLQARLDTHINGNLSNSRVTSSLLFF